MAAAYELISYLETSVTTNRFFSFYNPWHATLLICFWIDISYESWAYNNGDTKSQHNPLHIIKTFSVRGMSSLHVHKEWKRCKLFINCI